MDDGTAPSKSTDKLLAPFKMFKMFPVFFGPCLLWNDLPILEGERLLTACHLLVHLFHVELGMFVLPPNVVALPCVVLVLAHRGRGLCGLDPLHDSLTRPGMAFSCLPVTGQGPQLQFLRKKLFGLPVVSEVLCSEQKSGHIGHIGHNMSVLSPKNIKKTCLKDH